MSLPPVVSSPNAPGWSRWIERLRAATGGRFTIIRELGRGGFAAVFLAQQLQPNRRVAIKLLLPTHLDSQWALEHFRGESQKIAEWRHQAVVTIYEVHEVDELFFFVMSYVEGGSLHDLIQEIGPLPIGVARSVLAQIGSALQYAHRQGVTHRDVKPQNVLIDTDGGAVVTDFGISKQVGSASHTVTGMIFGSPPYMAPEQCATGKTSAASDQYALGIVAFEMLTGRPPFSGAPMQVLISHMQDPVPALRTLRPDCPPELEAAVARMLSKEPEQRFASVAEAIHAAGAAELPDFHPDRRAFADAARRTSERAHTAVLEILSIPPSIEVGDRISIEAQAKTIAGEPLVDTPIEWSVDNEHVARLDTNGGTLTALKAGEMTLVAKTRGTQQQIRVTVVPPKVAQVEVNGPSEPVRVGTQTMLLATARSKNGVQIPASARWSTSDESLATVAADGTLRTLKPGRAKISAQVEEVVTEFWLEVIPPTVSEVRITGSNAALTIGDKRQLTAVVLDTTDQVLSDHPVQWAASDRRIATVSPTGLVVAIGAGTITISARAGVHGSELTFAVQEPRAAHVELQKPVGMVHVGDRARLRAIVRDERGNAVDRPVTWVSSNAAIARVEPDGTVMTVAPGNVGITATIDGVTAVLSLNVTGQPVQHATPVPAAPARIPAASPLPSTTSETRGFVRPGPLQKSRGTRLAGAAVAMLLLAGTGYYMLNGGTAGDTPTQAAAATTNTPPESPPASVPPPATPAATQSTPAPTGSTGSDRPRAALTLRIAAPATSVAIGDSIRLDAIASDGTTPDEIRWSSANSRRAAVTASGLVRGVSEGLAIIVARAGPMVDSIRLNVRPRAIVTAPPPSPAVTPPQTATSQPPVVTPPRDTATPPPVVRPPDNPPVRSDPPPPSPEVIAERQIRQLVGEYAAALEARNINEVARIYPTIPRRDREGWQGMFDQRFARDLKVTWRVDNVDVSAGTATARVNGVTQFTQQSPRKQCSVPVSMNVRFTNASGAWRIASIQQLNEAGC